MRHFFALLTGLLMTLGAVAQGLAPDALVRSVTNDVLDIVRKDKDIQAGNTRKAVELAEVKVLPHFDFAHMTRLEVGKALTEYRNQTIDFKPVKMQAADTDVVVRTLVQQPGSKPVEIDYSLDRTDQGWKVYDISVAAVSLVTNYRSSFAQEISAGGIDGLIGTLRTKNGGGEAAVASKQ